MKKATNLLLLSFLLAAFATTGAGQSNATAAAPGKAVFLIMGDSVMKEVSILVERDLAQSTEFRPVSFTSIGSGLCRLDLLDWHAKIKALTETEKPADAVILIGSNDTQPMQTEQGVLRQGSDEWLAEYARRVGKCMDIMIQGGVKNIIWISLPDMRDPALEKHVLVFNGILAKEAASRPAVEILDTQKYFSREPGKFTLYIAGPDGMPLNVRVKDGVHFNREGAKRLADIIVKTLDATKKK